LLLVLRESTFFQNILLKSAQLCDSGFQNYGAVNSVQFFLVHPVYFTHRLYITTHNNEITTGQPDASNNICPHYTQMRHL